jgi:flagellin
MLTRLKQISTQSASSNTTDRVALDNERANLTTEINNIAQNTKYGSTTLLGGASSVSTYGLSITVGNGIANIDVSNAAITTTTGVTFAFGTTGAASLATLTIGTTTQTLSVTTPTGTNQSVLNFNNLGVKITVNASLVTISAANVFTVSTGTSSFTYFMGDENQNFNKIQASLKNFMAGSTDVLNLGAAGDISTQAGAQNYLGYLDTAINNLTTERGNLGAAMNQIGYHVANMESMSQNTKAATSTIKDADFASEMATFTKDQILTQAGVSMLAQANQMNQQILSLLK